MSNQRCFLFRHIGLKLDFHAQRTHGHFPESALVFLHIRDYAGHGVAPEKHKSIFALSFSILDFLLELGDVILDIFEVIPFLSIFLFSDFQGVLEVPGVSFGGLKASLTVGLFLFQAANFVENLLSFRL